MDLWRHQWQELESANPQPGELETERRTVTELEHATLLRLL